MEFITLLHLKLYAEKERAVFLDQLSKEKSMLADRWGSYEKNVALLCEQKKELEMERDAILIEKVCFNLPQLCFVFMSLSPLIFSNGDDL